MWTLINSSSNLTTGIFKSAWDADTFHKKHCPEIVLTPIELLLNQDHADAIDANDFYTWTPQDDEDVISADIPMHRLVKGES